MNTESRDEIIAQRRREAFKQRASEPFGSFEELASAHRENEAYTRVTLSRDSSLAIIAPHGGALEPGTSEISKALAGSEHNLYTFDALESDWSLHITSHRFDDQACVDLIKDCSHVVAIHGCQADFEAVFIGGRDKEFRAEIRAALKRAGVKVYSDKIHKGRSKNNICNRGERGVGVQLEFSLPLRDRIRRELGSEGDTLTSRMNTELKQIFTRFAE